MELKEDNTSKLWYKAVTYEDAKDLVRENLVSTVSAFIASGYWLKCIRDSRGYEKDGYQTLWECAEAEFGLKKSEASRAMSMNDKYAVDGNSPYVIESYKQYSKSQLHEMLKMTDEQMEQVTPDMTVKDIREIKREKIEAFGEAIKPELESWERLLGWVQDFVWDEYMGLLQDHGEAAGISIEMLQQTYGQELCIRTRQEIVMIDVDFGNAQLVNKDTGEILGEYALEYVLGEIDRNFQELRKSKQKSECCDIATDTVNTVCGGESVEEFLTEIEVVPEQEEPLNVEFDTDELMRELDSDEDETAGSAEGLKKCITGFSRYDTCSCCGHDGIQCCAQCSEDCNGRCGWIEDPYIPEEGDGVQEKAPEIIAEPQEQKLPKFKNDSERKAWIEDVEAWGLWYEDPNIEARYYRYDFSDGSRLIAVKYRYSCPPWVEKDWKGRMDGAYEDLHYHMIYGEEYRNSNEYAYEKYYGQNTVSATTLIDFIKKLTKKGKGHE